MIDDPIDTRIASALREQIAQGDQALMGLGAVVAHLLAQPAGALVNEAIIARLRGMIEDITRQLLGSQRDVDLNDPAIADHIDGFSAVLMANKPLLEHCHAMALEGRLTEQLERTSSLEQILSPLMQELIASERADVAELAMAALAAQSSFVQHQARMAINLNDLPAELFHSVLAQWQDFAKRREIDLTIQSVEALRTGYDESATRGAKLSRLVTAMGKGARASLELPHAGIALFTTALGMASSQSRQLAVISCFSGHLGRLTLALRAAGLTADEIRPSLAMLDPSATLPAGLDEIHPDQAHSILRDSEAGQN